MIALSSYRTYRPYIRLKVSLLLLALLRLSVCVVGAQTSNPQIASPQARIAQDLKLIRMAEQEPLPAAQQGALWAQLASEYEHAAEFLKAEDAYNRSLHLLKTAPSARAEYASTLDSLASLYMIYGRVDDAESARKQALTVRQKLGNLSDIAVSHVHLADIAFARHQFKKAEQLALRGIEEMESSVNPPSREMLFGFITIAYARCSRGHCGEGLVSAEQAVAFANRNFGSESAADGFALETLGFAEWKNGATQDGEKAMLHSIQILRTKLAPADPRLAGAMLQYCAYLTAANRQVEAQEIHEQVARMTSQAGTFCPGCAVSVNSLSKTLR
jgi:tetratricopeptide (TPR) repeat protein